MAHSNITFLIYGGSSGKSPTLKLLKKRGTKKIGIKKKRKRNGRTW